MEIHPPHGPVSTLNQTLVQLTIITAGILIALSLEGVVTWFDHRALGREARANLMSEIRDNHKELEGLLRNLVTEKKSLEQAAGVVRKLMKRETISGNVGLDFHTAELRATSRTTANVTGAFAHMEYEEVKAFSSVYDLQDMFDVQQRRAGELMLAATAGFQLMSLDAPSAGELERWHQDIRMAYMSLTAEEQMGAELLKRYAAILAER